MFARNHTSGQPTNKGLLLQPPLSLPPPTRLDLLPECRVRQKIRPRVSFEVQHAALRLQQEQAVTLKGSLGFNAIALDFICITTFRAVSA